MKYLTLLLLLTSTHLLHSQETSSPHTWLLGGYLSFNSQTNRPPLAYVYFPSIPVISYGRNDDSKSTAFALSPYIGKHLNAHWLIGLDLQYTHSRYTSQTTFFSPEPDTLQLKQINSDLGLGLFVRYAFLPDSRFDFFLQPFVQYFTSREEDFNFDELTQKLTSNYMSIGSDLGITFLLNDRWRATTRIGVLRYVFGSWDVAGTDEGNNFSSFGFNTSLRSIAIGLEVKL